MVERFPPSEDWKAFDDSTVIHSAAFDEAADRIFVRLLRGGIVVFEGCDESNWRNFTTPGVSRGEYMTNVLERHSYRRHYGV